MNISVSRVNLALDYMLIHANTLGVKAGVAFVSVTKIGDNSGITFDKILNNVMVRRPSKDQLQTGDTGTNYYGVAMSKLAVMKDTKANSGTFTEYVREGEASKRGGILRTFGDYVIYVGFDGSDTFDVEIARAGLLVLELEDEPKG